MRSARAAAAAPGRRRRAGLRAAGSPAPRDSGDDGSLLNTGRFAGGAVEAPGAAARGAAVRVAGLADPAERRATALVGGGLHQPQRVLARRLDVGAP